VKKRIILLLDGTWNESDFGGYDTNIVTMREAISRTLRVSGSAKTATSTAALPNDLKVTSTVTEEKLNIVFYERGVGTAAFLERYFGGAFGQELSTNIRRAYKFLSFHYEPGRSRIQRRRTQSADRASGMCFKCANRISIFLRSRRDAQSLRCQRTIGERRGHAHGCRAGSCATVLLGNIAV